MEQISIGSIVKLKSGGPQMTVKGYGTKLKVGSMVGAYVEDTEQVQCQWFDVAETLQEGQFPVASVTLD